MVKKEKLKVNIIASLTCGIGIGVIVLVGIIVIQEVNEQFMWADVFCAGKDNGTYFMNDYLDNVDVNFPSGNLTCMSGEPMLSVEAST